VIVFILVRVQSPNAKSNVCKSAGSKTFVRVLDLNEFDITSQVYVLVMFS